MKVSPVNCIQVHPWNVFDPANGVLDYENIDSRLPNRNEALPGHFITTRGFRSESASRVRCFKRWMSTSSPYQLQATISAY